MLDNLIGRTNSAKLTDFLFPPEQPRTFGYIDCYCDGYLASAMQGGFFALASFILALLIGGLARTKSKASIFLATLWIAVQSGCFYEGYRDIQKLLEFIPQEKRAERLSDLTLWLNHYLEGIAGQLAFNTVLLFMIPASFAYLLARKTTASP